MKHIAVGHPEIENILRWTAQKMRNSAVDCAEKSETMLALEEFLPTVTQVSRCTHTRTHAHTHTHTHSNTQTHTQISRSALPNAYY